MGVGSSWGRTADPYRDTDVIDARAPRANQVFVGTVSVVAVVTGWWPLLALVALQLAIGLTLGRRYCLPCWFYFEVVQPRRGEGAVEDSRPPRFANIVGLVVLSAATLSYAAGFATAGAALATLVAVLALVAAGTGFCVGCELYRLGARLRGVRPGRVDRVDPADFALGQGASETVVLFSHPLCTGCRELEQQLSGQGTPTHVVDVSASPELARKYHVSIVPSAFSVHPADGRVLARIA